MSVLPSGVGASVVERYRIRSRTTPIWLVLTVGACGTPKADRADSDLAVDEIEEHDVADANDVVDTSDATDTSDTLQCELDAAPDIGCPCTNLPGVTPYCCTRASDAKLGWICDSGHLTRFYIGDCDGDPRGCEICPLCPVEWEPPWWNGVE